MLISTRGRYALRVLVDMAEHQTEGFLPLKEVALRQEISEKYLESIIKILVQSGIVTGQRGKGGGYRLSRPPEEINVGEVLQMQEGPLVPVSCLADGSPSCPRQSLCRTIEFWRGLDDTINNYIHSFTIADLLQSAQPGNDYII